MVTARMHRLSIVFLVSISVFAMTWHYLGGADRQLVITPEIAEYKAIDDKSRAELDDGHHNIP